MTTAIALEVGKPYLWKSKVYGDTAVHFTGLSPNGLVANFTIDGGEASKQAQNFPELSDGVYFALIGQLVKRPARVRKPKAAEHPQVTAARAQATENARRRKDVVKPVEFAYREETF